MLQSSLVNHPVAVGEETYDYKKMLLKATGCVTDEVVKQVGDDGVASQLLLRQV